MKRSGPLLEVDDLGFRDGFTAVLRDGLPKARKARRVGFLTAKSKPRRRGKKRRN